MPDPGRESEALRHYLADRDIPCPGCGYNLRGLPSDRCPECSQPLQLSVTLQDPHVGALLATILPPAAVAGAAATIVIILLLTGVRRHGFPPRDIAILILWLPLAISLVLGIPTLWLSFPRGRAWFRRQNRPARKTVLLWSWVATAACFLAYVGYLMSQVH